MTNILKKLSLLFFLSFSTPLFSQTEYDDLLNNKDITWVMEFYQHFLFEKSDSLPYKYYERQPERYTNYGNIKTIKSIDTTELGIESNKLLMRSIVDAIRTEKLDIYASEKCETKSKIEANDLYRWFVINSFVARQVIYYDAKKKQYGLRTLAIKIYTNENVMGFSMKPTFWIKAQDLDKKPDLNDGTIQWAANMQLKDGIVLEGNAQHFLKKSVGDLPAVKPMFEQFFADTTVAFYGLYEPLMPPFVYGFTKSEREDIIYTKIDSIETIDPETYERHLLIAPIVGCKPEDIKRLEIVQNWYWDDKKKQMGVYFKAVAPLKEEEVSYNGREFVYKRIFPVFYKPTGE